MTCSYTRKQAECSTEEGGKRKGRKMPVGLQERELRNSGKRGDRFEQFIIRCVPNHDFSTGVLCFHTGLSFGLSLQGSLYSKELWKTEIASPFRANGRSLHFHYIKGNCLGECKEVPNSSLYWYEMKTGKLPYGQQTSSIPCNI